METVVDIFEPQDSPTNRGDYPAGVAWHLLKSSDPLHLESPRPPKSPDRPQNPRTPPPPGKKRVGRGFIGDGTTGTLKWEWVRGHWRK